MDNTPSILCGSDEEEEWKIALICSCTAPRSQCKYCNNYIREFGQYPFVIPDPMWDERIKITIEVEYK